MAQVITIQPITRIEGHASIGITLDDSGNVADARLNYMSLRGFEKFIEGKPAEEIPRIVTRICGICPWMHHLASNKDYTDYIGEHVEPNSYGKYPYARFWNEGFSMNLDSPRGVYRSPGLRPNWRSSGPFSVGRRRPPCSTIPLCPADRGSLRL